MGSNSDAAAVNCPRYGGDGLTDEERYREMLRELRGVPPERRGARYRCVVALCSPEGRETETEGTVEGVLLDEPRGDGGFGYDPIFFYPPLGATFSQITPEAKHAVSHRGRAMALILPILREWLADPG
jgi:XTP/dITP diphosphohydrolase